MLQAEATIGSVIMGLEVGCVHVYTGSGKGKTTASVGQAIRAHGQGLKVVVIQFMKAGGEKSGEVKMVEKLIGREVLRFGRSFIGGPVAPTEEDFEELRLGLAEARRVLASGYCDLLVLDELNVAIHYGLVDLEDVLDIISAKPPKVELVISGRYAHPRILELADYVTEMTLVKHPYSAQVPARRGIEY